jgi:hypothetical protein
MLISVVTITGNAEVAPETSSEWVEVARGSGGIAHTGTPENGTDLFSVRHREWRIRWSVVPVDNGLPIVDGSDFRFIVRPEFGVFDNIADVSGKVFSEPETGVIVISANDGFRHSLNRTYYVETHISGYTSYELIVEENVTSDLLDVTPPELVVLSPENKTYNIGKNVSVTFIVNEPTSYLWYMLDNYGEMGILRNVSLKGLPEGPHKIQICARDEAGNIKNSEVIYFSVEEPFSTTLIVIAAITMVIIGLTILVYYYKKRKS